MPSTGTLATTPRAHAIDGLSLHTTPSRGDWTSTVLLPALLLAASSTRLMAFGGDFVVADLLYRLQGERWAYRSTWLATDVLHVAGRDTSVFAWLVVVGAWLASSRIATLRRWRRPLAYLALATAMGVVLTSLLKAASPLDCPWDLVRYGGTREFTGWFTRHAAPGGGGCFPAGHASAGYAWLALYFFFARTVPRWRRRGLFAALAVGLVFGLSQQFRGAHFPSHDVWTAAICWFSALALDAAMFRRPAAPRGHSEETPHAG